MGVDTRRPVLPAPTESIVDTLSGSVTGTDLATDISRRTDKTSYSIPDDGTPVTIPTRRKHRVRGDDSKLSRSSQHSQTSLLIEYFEGGKGSGSIVSRPSVRVRVTPSSAKKSKDPSIHITESSGNRRPAYSRRISFGSPSKNKSQEAGGDDLSFSPSDSATDENLQAGHPVEIELVNRDQGSELSSFSRDHKYTLPNSDVSSMPADSMLEASSLGPRRKRSQSLERDRSQEEPKDYLKTPTRQRSRSLSAERIVQRAAEKVSHYSREPSSGKRRRSGQSKGISSEDIDSKPSRRRVRDDDMASPESSLLSASAVSSHRRSGDQYSFRSNTSKSSLNNPKLLETVEDAIRRLILPELKELKKDQKVMSNTSKFERDLNASYSSASTPSRDELGRRLSKHASAPDVRKPKVIISKDSHDEETVIASEYSQGGRRASKDSEMTNDTGYISRLRPELTEQDKIRRQRSKGLRDAEKAAIVGNRLTTANLEHHDSRSSLDKNETRDIEHIEPRGVNETELVFQRHNVAPMPLRSAVETELTRDSILSERTAEPISPFDNSKIQDVFRSSPTSRAPSRTPLGSRHDLGLKHSNLSNHDLSIHSASDNDRREWSHSPLGDAAAGAIAAAAAANLLDIHSDSREIDFNDRLHPRRALSPIQSVASNQSESHIKQDSTQHYPQEYSGDEKEVEPRLSIDSLSSAPSTSLARSKRPEGLSVASQTEIIRNQKESGHELGYEESPALSPLSARDKRWLDEESDGEGEDFRQSMAETTASTDGHRLTGYTEDSDIDYIEKANQGRPIAEGIGANPQFVHPSAVESAVASLLDPSILDTKSNQSGGNRSQSNVLEQVGLINARSMERTNDVAPGSRQGSPLKQRQDASSPDATSFPRRMGATSPPQSVTQSLEDQTDPVHMFQDQDDHIDSPIPEGDDRNPDTESEINTNPSIIQGPIGGVAHDSTWPYNQTIQKEGQSPLYDTVGVPAGGAGLGLGTAEEPSYSHDYYPTSGYDANNYLDQPYARGPMLSTPPGAKDEGYMSAANPLSPSPDPATKGFGALDSTGLGLFDSPTEADDQFGGSHKRHFSGYSHGVGSPLYDSATGKGIERIQSKDIVALMDHLTVRDAQRNARDTEILVTLVRSAAEMRNSFEEMKKFIAQQDGLLQDANDRQHERTYKALGGPRPLPASGFKSSRQVPVDEEDLPAKRKNLFKRALKGLNLKSSNDLSKIEEMLEQLLEEVEALRAGQDDMYLRSGNRAPPSVDLDGYEPEGHAGTSSPGDHSGYLSTFSRPAPESRSNGLRENRVSTVPEDDEEDADLDERGEFLSPQLQSQESPESRHERAGSAPLSTPPRGTVASGALSNETTPKTNEKSRKHKSSSSSFFPKISRWSKTTASSMGDNIRNSIQPGRKERVSFDTSRSGSDLGQGNYKTNDYYDPQGDDRIRSTFTLDESQQQENRPPSPLVPSQISEAPKYRAHRDSLDLQHPQPRQGPTGRYQNQLETQAQIYGVPAGATHSDQWGSNPSFSALNGNRRLSGGSRLSPISDAGYSETSSRAARQGPPRPPKIKDEGPLFPERPPKTKEIEEQSYADRVALRNASPRNTPPPRKPTGPRPLNSGSQYNSPNRRKRSSYRGSPEQVDDEHDY